jgi:hypothetical protein
MCSCDWPLITLIYSLLPLLSWLVLLVVDIHNSTPLMLSLCGNFHLFLFWLRYILVYGYSYNMSTGLSHIAPIQQNSKRKSKRNSWVSPLSVKSLVLLLLFGVACYYSNPTINANICLKKTIPITSTKVIWIEVGNTTRHSRMQGVFCFGHICLVKPLAGRWWKL